MSIRTNPKKAIPLVLRRLMMTRTTKTLDKSSDEKLEKLTSQLDQIKDLFMAVKSNGDELLDTLTLLDRHLRSIDEDNIDKEKFESDIDTIFRRIKDSTEKLLPKGWASQGEIQTSVSSKVTASQDHKTRKLHSAPSSSQHKDELHEENLSHNIEVSYEKLEGHLQPCLLSLLVFPEDAVINKRHTIYWWIGEGFVKSAGEKTAEEVGEGVVDELLNCRMIVAHGNGLNPIVKSFKINPRIRGELVTLDSRKTLPHLGSSFQIFSNQRAWLVLEKRKVVLGDDHLKPNHWKSIFNVGASYLSFDSEWLVKMKSLEVLQLGRWQDSPSHHIEVGSEEFLKELRDHKQLKYLSLRGISRIPELPPSIEQLENLEILDLKACHSLEALPKNIASMKSLTHLDVSECYLLDSMPRGIEKLTQLQVLKGFVIGSSSKSPCRISDLANLKKLKRFSVHIGSEAVIQDMEFESLKELTAVNCLKISWGVSGEKYSDIQVLFPSSLEKLDLEGFPGSGIPEWLKPSRVPGAMKKLYIKGGKLKSLDHGEICHKWHVEILRLKYLKHLQIEERKLHKLFPSLRYVERTMVLNQSFPEWRLEE